MEKIKTVLSWVISIIIIVGMAFVAQSFYAGLWH